MTRHLKYGRQLLRWGASYLLIIQWTLPPLKTQEIPPPAQLNIVVVDGEGAMNQLRQRTSRDPVLRIEDENQRPLAGAAVVFTLPTEGASGEFNGSKTSTLMTDNQGRVTARGLKVNGVPGKLQIHVNASYRGARARTTITQFNIGEPGGRAGGSGKVIAILAIVGAAAAGGAVAAMHKNGNATPSATPSQVAAIGITPGASTVGPPH